MSNRRKKRFELGRISSIGIPVCAILLQFCSAGLFDSGRLQAQSTVVEAGAVGFGKKADGVRNSLSDAFLRTESFLNQPVEDIELTLDQLVRQFRDNGIAVWVDYDVQQEVEYETLTLAKSPSLAQSIGHALGDYAATYSVMHDGAVKIIIAEEAGSSNHFLNVIYDITPLVDDLKRLSSASVGSGLNRSRPERGSNSSVVVLPLQSTQPERFLPRFPRGGGGVF